MSETLLSMSIIIISIRLILSPLLSHGKLYNLEFISWTMFLVQW